MEIMDQSKKKKFMVVCLLPVIITIISIIYYVLRVAPNLETPSNHMEIMALFNNEHGNILMGLLLINFITHLASLIYCIVHLARIKNMSAGTKIGWIVFLAALMPASLLVFYFMEIKREPKYLETYADIA